MKLSDFEITLNGEPTERFTTFPDLRSKNQRKKDRKEYFKNKRKSRGSLTIKNLPWERPWHERIIIKDEK